MSGAEGSFGQEIPKSFPEQWWVQVQRWRGIGWVQGSALRCAEPVMVAITERAVS